MSSEFVRNIHLATAQRLKDEGADASGIIEHFDNVFLPVHDISERLGQMGYPQQDLKQFLKGRD